MRKGTYYYRRYDFNGGYTRLSLRVEILAETERCYRIKYLEFHADGSRPGTIIRARKKNVRPDEGWIVRKSPSPENIRLPYKD